MGAKNNTITYMYIHLFMSRYVMSSLTSVSIQGIHTYVDIHTYTNLDSPMEASASGLGH